jgi:glycosyltransferase involved in cell wall biosynthesis
MRIAVVASTQEIVGGAEVYVRWALRDLVAHGHTVGFAFEYAGSRPERLVDQDVASIPRWCFSELGRTRSIEEIRRFSPDVVYLNYTTDPEIELELSRRFRCVLFAHSYYGTCLTGTRRHNLPTPQICSRRFGAACIATNYLRSCGIWRPDHLVRQYRHQARRLLTLESVGAIVVASSYVRTVFERQGIALDKIHRIPPPVLGVTREIDPPSERPFTNRVLLMGRLTALKGLPDAVESVAIASRALERRLVLQVAGEGPEEEPARRLSRALGVETHFMGWQNDEQRARLLAQADVLIVPSRWAEPFGMVGVEAACLGVPSVAYPVGGIPDWLRDGVGGELARGPSLDSRALASALVRALRSREHHQKLREGAWRTSAEYSPAVHHQRLLELLDRVALTDRAEPRQSGE